MNEKIFISYSRKDKDLVFMLKDEIEQRVSTKCWIDLRGIESDQQFSEVILEAINNTEIFIFMYSQNSAESEWTKKELNFADVKKKKIVFVNLNGSDLDDWFLLNFGLKDRIDLKDKDQKEKLFRNLKDWCYKKESLDNKINNAETLKFNLKIKSNQDCQVLIDEEELGLASANKITKFPLALGEYSLACVSKESNTRIDLEDFKISDGDILRKVEFTTRLFTSVNGPCIATETSSEKDNNSDTHQRKNKLTSTTKRKSLKFEIRGLEPLEMFLHPSENLYYCQIAKTYGIYGIRTAKEMLHLSRKFAKGDSINYRNKYVPYFGLIEKEYRVCFETIELCEIESANLDRQENLYVVLRRNNNNNSFFNEVVKNGTGTLLISTDNKIIQRLNRSDSFLSSLLHIQD